MKVFQNGTEVTDAKITYSVSGDPQYVTANGVRMNASAFRFEEEKIVKKTKDAPKKKTKKTK